MEITGKVLKILPVQTGTGIKGTWKKQEFIIEVPGQFPKKVCFSLWGDRIDKISLAEGEEIEVSFDLESREANNSKWYTEARAWKVVKKAAAQGMPPEDDPLPGYMENPMENDLPF